MCVCSQAMPATNAMTAPLPISVIVLTKDEELAIVPCLESLRYFSEVFVVDSGSSDATAALAEERGAHVLQFNWNGRYPKKKQWALENAPISNEWVLYVDADEMVTRELASELASIVPVAPEYAAFAVELDYVFCGRRLRHGHKVVKTALLRVGRNHFPEVDDLGATNMWEVEGHYQPVSNGRVGRLAEAMVHHDREPLFHYFDRHNRYSDWEAHLRASPEKSAVVARVRSDQGRRFARIPGKPLAFFLYSLVIRRGYRDGVAGINYAIANLFYFWQIYLKADEIRRLSGPNGSPSDSEASELAGSQGVRDRWKVGNPRISGRVGQT